VSSFAELHAPGRMLLLPNAWDVASAVLVERAGAEAVATSSAAVAWSLGYPDGQKLPLGDLLRAVTAMRGALKVPLTVDFERGYSDDPAEVAANVARLADAGAAGVNLEDAAEPSALLAAKLKAVKQARPTIFLNARTCIVLRNKTTNVVPDVLARAKVYAEAGADGFFVPRLTDAAAIDAIVKGTSLPLNLLVVPGLPPLAELRRLGVRRVSAGPRLAEAAYSATLAAANAFLERGDLQALQSTAVGFSLMQAMLGG
jgi:2-methylisocitrate lyase-like PEP mutase family enzyme